MRWGSNFCNKDVDMTDLSSKFTRDDIETLIESVGDWELIGNQEFHMMQMIRNAPMPPEDHEAFEPIQQIKDWYAEREKTILQSKAMRQEKAVFLKAKLMLVRKEMDIHDLFEMATDDPQTAEKRPINLPAVATELENKLKMAEFFIRDLGVWDHYVKFLTEKSQPDESGE
jgi:hypothetical protein